MIKDRWGLNRGVLWMCSAAVAVSGADHVRPQIEALLLRCLDDVEDMVSGDPSPSASRGDASDKVGQCCPPIIVRFKVEPGWVVPEREAHHLLSLEVCRRVIV